MNIEEAKEDFKSSIAMTLHGGKHTIVSIKSIETVLLELENSISISKVEEAIEELYEEIGNCERRQNEVIALGGDDLHIREEIWDLEDKIHSLKQILEGLDVLKELQK